MLLWTLYFNHTVIKLIIYIFYSKSGSWESTHAGVFILKIIQNKFSFFKFKKQKVVLKVLEKFISINKVQKYKI